jgi:hypothetical protein
MPKISGIDFNGLKALREGVSIALMDGTEYELPLIPVRYADEADSLLRRNSILAIRYAGVQAKINSRVDAIMQLKEQLEQGDQQLEEAKEDEYFATFDKTYRTIAELQAQTAELCRASNELCDEIRAFISKFVDSTVVEQLAMLEDKWTARTLELMLYGSDAVDKVEEEATPEEENPSTAASQSN